MLDIRWIRDNPDLLDEALKKRGAAPESAALIELDEMRRTHIAKLQEAQARRNAASKEIGAAMAAKDTAKAEALKAEVAEIKSFIQSGEDTERELSEKLNDALSRLPNVPLDDVPVGADENDNVEVRMSGQKPAFDFEAKEHFELGEALGQMDFETAAKLSGSRFTVVSGGLARLERALGQFMLDTHTQENGYTEVQPAAAGARRRHVRHRAIAEIRRGPFPDPGRPLADPDRRSVADQPRARGNPRSSRRCRAAIPR